MEPGIGTLALRLCSGNTETIIVLLVTPSPTYTVKLELAATARLCLVTRPTFLEKRKR